MIFLISSPVRSFLRLWLQQNKILFTCAKYALLHVGGLFFIITNDTFFIMNKISLIAVLLFAFSANSFSQKKSPLDYVNPIIGTNGMGHTFPGACSPFGIVQLSPETDTIPHNVNGRYQGKVYEYCAGYQHHDKTIVGFSHTHLSGTGHSDLGDILIMPTTGKIQTNPGTAENPDGGYRSRFSHDTEKCTAGYYEVRLDDYNVLAQFTATQSLKQTVNLFWTWEAVSIIMRGKHYGPIFECKTRQRSQVIVSPADGHARTIRTLPSNYRNPSANGGITTISVCSITVSGARWISNITSQIWPERRLLATLSSNCPQVAN